MKITTKIMIAIIVAIILAALIFSKGLLTGSVVENLNHHSLTKAICNESNFCQDYEIRCIGEEIIEMAPIHGAFIQHTEDWQDPRGEQNLGTACRNQS